MMTELFLVYRNQRIALSRERISQLLSMDGQKLQRLFVHLHLKFGLSTPLPGDYLERYSNTENWPHNFLVLFFREFNAMEVEVDTVLKLIDYHEKYFGPPDTDECECRVRFPSVARDPFTIH